MLLAFLLVLLAAILFISIYDGAPYVPVHPKNRESALDLLNLKKGQTVLDLGSGDGSFLLAAHRRGLKGIGYEINPIIWLISVVRCYRYRSDIVIKLGNFWHHPLPKSDAIFVFLLTKHMQRLKLKVAKESPKVPLASAVFKIPNQKIVAEKDGSFLYLL